MRASNIRKPVFSAFAFFGTLCALSVGYAAYGIATENAGATLTKDKWNDVVNAVNDLDSRTSNFSFSPTMITATKAIAATSSSWYVGWLSGSNSDVDALGFNNTDSSRTWGIGVGGSGVGTVWLQGGKFGIWDKTATANRLTIDTTGKVGIGTTTPAERLDVGGGNVKMGYEIVTQSCTTSTSWWVYCTANCSAGKQVTGGACVQYGAVCPTSSQDVTATSYTCSYYSCNVATAYSAKAVCSNIR